MGLALLEVAARQRGMFSRREKPSVTMIGARRRQGWFAESLVTLVGSFGTPLVVNLVLSQHPKQEENTDAKGQKGASWNAPSPPCLGWSATVARGQG